jgi:RecA/RadA recombinase
MAKKTVEKESKKSSVISSDTSSLIKDINSFIKTQTKIEVESLQEHDFIPEFLNSGNYALNWAMCGKMLTGGVPMTKVFELFGDPGSGKSLMLVKFAGENIKKGGISYIVDTEDAVNPLFSKIILNDPKGEIVGQIQRIDTIDTIEQLRSFLINLAEKKIAMKNNAPVFIGVDSISQLSSEKEMEDAKSGSMARDMTKAQAMRGLFRVVNRYLRDANITLAVLSHTSSAIGGFGNPVTAANHGGGVKFASSLRIWITSSKEVSDSNGIPLGVRMNFKVDKNRMVFKNRKASVNLSFKKGIQKYSGLLEILADNGIVKMTTKDVKKTTKVTYQDEEFSANKIEEWIESKGGDEKVIAEWETKLNAIYGNDDAEDGLDSDTSDESYEDLNELEIINE